MLYIAYTVLFLSIINLLRMAFFLIASDIHDILGNRKKKNKSKFYFKKSYHPLVSIIVPAHNEEKTLKENLLSIAQSSYKNVEVIIVNDCSTDRTFQIARNFQRHFNKNLKRIKILNVNFRGKAKALNQGLKFIRGSLFMCLDADSRLTSNALAEAVFCFREKSLGGLSSNVKISPRRGLLNLIQRIEYLVCYQMKKAETLSRIQYIVGGIGSMYRSRILRTLKYYETDTITEDIDLSMKLIEHYGNKTYIGYNPSVIVFTEAAVSIGDLLKQRYRWKYGRYQVFLKRNKLFWSKKTKYNPLLSWIYLPYALFGELAYALEPLTFALIFYLVFNFGDFRMIVGSLITFCFYTIIQISGATQSYCRKERFKLIIVAPIAYILMYVLSFVEYVATIRGLLNLKKLITNFRQGQGECEWVHVSRPDLAQK